jgi:hypothetical protein
MRRELSNLEDQVGGLAGRERARAHRRAMARPAAPEPLAAERYELTAPVGVSIRAARASDDPTQRQVA